MTATSTVRALAMSALLAATCLVSIPAVARQAPGTNFDLADSSSGNFLAALIAGAKRDTAASAVYWREALRGDTKNQDLLNRAFIASVADGDFAEGGRLAERVIQRDAKNGLARIFLGVRALKNRQYAAAREQFRNAGGRGANADLTASILTAWTYVGTGNLDKALATSDKAVRDPGLSSYRNFFGGLMADVGGNRTEALKRLKAAYEADPGVIRVADTYARMLARNGNTDEALKIYGKLEEQSRPQPLIAQPLAELRSGKIPDPLVSTVTEGASELFYGLGTLGGRSGDEVAALIYLQTAGYLNPSNEIVGFTMAEIFEQTDQCDRASAIYEKVPDSSAFKSRASIRRAVCMEKMGRGDEGITALKAQVERSPDDLDAVDTLAALLRSKKRWSESAEAYSGPISRLANPQRSNWNLFYGRGIAYERAKEWPKAEADFQKALTLLPAEPTDAVDRRDKAQVLNYLGYSWVDMGLHIDEAFPMLKKAVELSPSDGYIVDSLGWAHFRRGHFEDAVKDLERAIELRPADPTINDHLGDAYWRVGRKLEAKFQWNHTRDLKPEPDDLTKILAKIDNGLTDETPTTAVDTSKKDGSGG